MSDEPSPDDLDQRELTATLELLEEENRRLRAEFARARQQRYRYTALGLAAIGFAAILAGAIFADVRDVLFALGATGLFAGVLVYYLTPDAVISADVGERVYTAMATNQAAIADSLGLADVSRYVPYNGEVRLFIPQLPESDLPDEINGPFITDHGGDGLLLVPTGSPLFEVLERSTPTIVEGPPARVAEHLADAVTDQFELAHSVSTDHGEHHITFAVSGSTMGDVDRFDHPLSSLLAVGLAHALDQVVELEVTGATDDRYEWTVTCRWDEPTDEV